MTQFDAFADFRMNGHHVIITGGAQNIGAGIAKTLASAGANVMIADLQGDKAKETAANIGSRSGQPLPWHSLRRNELRGHKRGCPQQP